MINYIKFKFKSVEPLRIANDSTSESGQVSTLSYIPGSAIRGAVADAFVRSGEFEKYKKDLLSDRVAFLNAYITADGRELIPSLKGFYEDKTEGTDEGKEIENFLAKGEITPGNKRSSLGMYCYIEDDHIFYTGVRMGSDMKINKGKHGDKRNVFRNEYMEPGYTFSGCIAVYDDDSSELSRKITDVLERMRDNDELVLGGSRSFGYGKCIILGEIDAGSQMPYQDYALNTDAEDIVYMALLSDMSMVNGSGENVGIDTGILAKELGVEDISIKNCATSVVDVRGYNRTWQTWVPSSKMYEKGSVFKFDLKGTTVSAAALQKVMDEGIGIRNNEGYGRVIFLKDYDKITIKKEITSDNDIDILKKNLPALRPDEEKTLRIAAKGHYMNCIDRAQEKYLTQKGEKGRKKLADYHLNSSQLGAIESILYNDQYTEDGGFGKLIAYLNHAKKKDDDQKVQKQIARRGDIVEYIEWLRDSSLTAIFEGLPESVMGLDAGGLLTEREISRIKADLVISEIRLVNRGGRKDE